MSICCVQGICMQLHVSPYAQARVGPQDGRCASVPIFSLGEPLTEPEAHHFS